MTVKESKAKYKQQWDEVGYDINTSTCNKCYPNLDDEVRCKCAFDLYNSNGDCLAEK